MRIGLRKPLFWIGSTKRDLKTFPDEVQDMMGHALDIAQQGKKHQDAKPLAGFGGAGVLEIVEDYAGDTYRAVYSHLFGKNPRLQAGETSVLSAGFDAVTSLKTQAGLNSGLP